MKINLVMKMENKLPDRKRLRLKDFDYSTSGAYFITVCTYNRKKTLSSIVGAIYPKGTSLLRSERTSPAVELTECGKIIERIIHDIPKRFNVIIDRYVIMPNHVHMIIMIPYNDELRAIRESPLQRRSEISKIMGYFKMNVSREIHNRFGNNTVWQRGFYDHVIRGKEDYEEIVRYIYDNPTRWYYDELYVEE